MGDSAVDEGRNGADIVSVGDGCMDNGYGCGGGGEKGCGAFSVTSAEASVSCLNILSREEGMSHGGGTMLALRWRLRRRASHSGNGAL